MSELKYRIARTDWASRQSDLMSLRKTVFMEEQGVPESLEWDNLDGDAIQLIATTSEGKPIGTARVLPTGQIGRLAVLREYRGYGVGQALLTICIDFGRTLPNIDRLFLNAQTSARHLYEKAGFVPVGKVFHEAGIPHIRMELTL